MMAVTAEAGDPTAITPAGQFGQQLDQSRIQSRNTRPTGPRISAYSLFYVYKALY